MTLTFQYKATTNVPVEVEGITPTALREASLSDIRQREIFHGNRRVPLAEMFDVDGDPSDLCWELHGDLSGVHWIGAHIEEGTIHVRGPAGRHVGSEMSGGQIVVDGDAGDWVGGEMHGGLIHIHGSCGHLIGAAYRGSRVGMTGGTILIDGNAGNEIAHTMRRGWICVRGSIGDMAGFNMLAGTLLVLGGCGLRPGAGMRRGTIALLGDDPPPLLPTFRYACRMAPPMLPLMMQQLAELGFRTESELPSEVELYHGDLLDGGRGEILLRV